MHTTTATQTNTMTEARVRAVMQKVAANFSAFVVAGHVTEQAAAKWRDDLTYLQERNALSFFELQITSGTRDKFGLRYVVLADGSLQQDSPSGGLDVYGLPQGTSVRLFASLREPAPPGVREELTKRGWSFNGAQLHANESEARSFSTGGYGLTRTKLGEWP